MDVEGVRRVHLGSVWLTDTTYDFRTKQCDKTVKWYPKQEKADNIQDVYILLSSDLVMTRYFPLNERTMKSFCRYLSELTRPGLWAMRRVVGRSRIILVKSRARVLDVNAVLVLSAVKILHSGVGMSVDMSDAHLNNGL